MAVPGSPSAIEATRTVEYRLGVDYQLNERPGKLAPLVGSMDSYSDKKAQIEDRFDDLEIKEKHTRHADTENTDPDVERRWIVKPKMQFVAPIIDRDDMLSTKLDLKSPIAVQTAKAVRRAADIRWLEGYYGTAYTGEDGATTVPFKAANIMAANTGEAADAGLTVNKLIAMREQMATALVDLEEEMPIGILTSKQTSDLLKINEVRSRDYNPLLAQALQTGKVGEFMGFRFIQAEIGNARAYGTAAALTLQTGTNFRRTPFFVPSGLHRGVWEEFFGRITERADKHYNSQVYGSHVSAVARVNEDKVFQMLNKEV